MMNWVRRLVLCGAVVCAVGGPAAAAADDREADREALRKQSRAFVEAFARGDAKAAASGWTENGEYYDDTGVAMRGRAEIEKAFEGLFKEQPQRRIEVDIREIRFPSRDCAIEEGTVIGNPGGAELPAASRYTAIHVREGGAWKIAVAREWGGGEEKLEDLGWLVGDWMAKAEQREIHLSFRWNEKKTFLRNEFRIHEGGQVASGGTQEIGRDPHTGQIRSWMFNDDGGQGQALWSRDGNRWVLNAAGVTPEGVPTTATNIITRNSNDEFVWRSVQRTVGNAEVPDTAPITVSRNKAGA